jgi:hypothetical protein
VIANSAAKALLWTTTTTIATAVVFEAVVVALALVGALRGGSSLTKWIVNVYWGTLGQLVLTLGMQLPLTLLMSGIWIGLVRRQPHLDQTRRGFLIGCLIVSVPATLAVWMFASGVNSLDATKILAPAVTGTALITMAFNYLGALLPRFIVPGLKQGQLVPPSSRALRSR